MLVISLTIHNIQLLAIHYAISFKKMSKQTVDMLTNSNQKYYVYIQTSTFSYYIKDYISNHSIPTGLKPERPDRHVLSGSLRHDLSSIKAICSS